MQNGFEIYTKKGRVLKNQENIKQKWEAGNIRWKRDLIAA